MPLDYEICFWFEEKIVQKCPLRYFLGSVFLIILPSLPEVYKYFWEKVVFAAFIGALIPAELNHSRKLIFGAPHPSIYMCM